MSNCTFICASRNPFKMTTKYQYGGRPLKTTTPGIPKEILEDKSLLKSCNKCRKRKVAIGGRYYGAGDWMCEDCLNEKRRS